MSVQNIILGVVVAVVVLLMLGASPFFVVDLTETAIVVRLGKPVNTIIEPGLKFKIPFVEEVHYFDKRLLDYDVPPQDVITLDKKTIRIDNYGKWTIRDPLKVYEAFRTQRRALNRLDDIIYSELRVELGKHTLTEIVSESRTDLMAKVTHAAGAKASAYGIDILDVRIKRADLPDQNEKAVFARMQAEREREAKLYRSQGEEEAQKIRSSAEKEREILLAEADKTAQELMGDGDAAAFAIFSEAYKKDPDFFAFTRSMEAYKKTMNEQSMLVISPDSEFFKYLKKSK
jgi:membrane protease subunit HflC|tara:strand:- start:100 stop:963 length:864 start_codon:yes stop_codon:yes gene_type:complete